MAKKYCITKHSVVSCHFGHQTSSEDVDRSNFNTQIDGFVRWVRSTTRFSQTALLDKKLIIKDAKADGNGHVAVVVWLAITEGTVGYALKMTAGRNAESQVVSKDFGRNNIPGCPLYYYIDANAGKVFTIRPELATINGRAEFEQVMREYMSLHSEGSQLPLSNDNGEVLVELPPGQRAVFSLRMDTVALQRDALLGNANKIYSLVHVVRPYAETRSPIDSFLTSMGRHLRLPVGNGSLSHIGSIRYEREITMSTDELTAILDREGELRGKERIGFRQKGTKGNILWADKVLERKTVELNLAESEGILTAEGILAGCPSAVAF